MEYNIFIASHNPSSSSAAISVILSFSPLHCEPIVLDVYHINHLAMLCSRLRLNILRLSTESVKPHQQFCFLFEDKIVFGV